MEVAAPAESTPMAEPIPMGLPLEMETPGASSADAMRALRRSETTQRFIIEAEPRRQQEMKAECPICFEPLCAGPVGVFLGQDGKRVSQHFFNLAAAREWLSSGTGQCPLTRKRITRVLEVPDIRQDPE